MTRQIKKEEVEEVKEDNSNPHIVVKRNDIFDEEAKRGNVDTHEEDEDDSEAEEEGNSPRQRL